MKQKDLNYIMIAVTLDVKDDQLTLAMKTLS